MINGETAFENEEMSLNIPRTRAIKPKNSITLFIAKSHQ
jgi:hypothetical protein